MIDYIQSSDDVIALRITGKLMRVELDEITKRVEKSLADREKTHIFVEIEDFSGFDVTALPEYLPRAAAMLGQLDRFGRIAVVSDLLWIRWATRIESALLPHISYETFTADERHRALAWVEGKLNPLHDPSIRIIETDKADVFGFELDGRISAADAEAAADYFNKALDRKRPLRLLARTSTACRSRRSTPSSREIPSAASTRCRACSRRCARPRTKSRPAGSTARVGRRQLGLAPLRRHSGADRGRSLSALGPDRSQPARDRRRLWRAAVDGRGCCPACSRTGAGDSATRTRLRLHGTGGRRLERRARSGACASAYPGDAAQGFIGEDPHRDRRQDRISGDRRLPSARCFGPPA